MCIPLRTWWKHTLQITTIDNWILPPLFFKIRVFFFVLELTLQTLNSKRSTCLCLPSAETKCATTAWLFLCVFVWIILKIIYFLNCYPMYLYFNNYSLWHLFKSYTYLTNHKNGIQHDFFKWLYASSSLSAFLDSSEDAGKGTKTCTFPHGVP